MKLRATKSGRIAKTPVYSDLGVSEEGGNALCPSQTHAALLAISIRPRRATCFMSRSAPSTYLALQPLAEREEDGELNESRVLYLTADGRQACSSMYSIIV